MLEWIILAPLVVLSKEVHSKLLKTAIYLKYFDEPKAK